MVRTLDTLDFIVSVLDPLRDYDTMSSCERKLACPSPPSRWRHWSR